MGKVLRPDDGRLGVIPNRGKVLRLDDGRLGVVPNRGKVLRPDDGRLNKPSHSWRGHGEISGAYWTNVRHNALTRGLAVTITIEEAWQVFLAQDRRCALSGVPITFSRQYTLAKATHTASLDRINNDQGYVERNIRWVHKIVNGMRMNMDDESFLFWCRKITKANRSK